MRAAALVPGGTAGSDASWAIPLAVGLGFALLSWFLMAEKPAEDTRDPMRATTQCETCGSALIEGWRLCPYCGGLNESSASEASGASQRVS